MCQMASNMLSQLCEDRAVACFSRRQAGREFEVMLLFDSLAELPIEVRPPSLLVSRCGSRCCSFSSRCGHRIWTRRADARSF
jgi:hypothetical protein